MWNEKIKRILVIIMAIEPMAESFRKYYLSKVTGGATSTCYRKHTGHCAFLYKRDNT
jgi:hypothetical protein